LAQARKKRASDQRRQYYFNRLLLVGLLIVVIVVTAYAFSRPTTVTLPAYLDRCIPGGATLAYKSTPELLLNISGVDYPIPAGIGIVGTCLRPLSTVDTAGLIHIATDVDRDYTLGDFFLVWGNTYGPSFATFNSNQVLSYKAGGSHTLSMIVDGRADNSFENYVFPRGANITTNPDIIAITYT
jgi:hypothetical protein